MKCLKCNTEYDGKYCPGCGARADKKQTGSRDSGAYHDLGTTEQLLQIERSKSAASIHKKRQIGVGTMSAQKASHIRLIIVCTVVSLAVIIGFAFFLWNVYVKGESEAKAAGASNVKSQLQVYHDISFQAPKKWERVESDNRIVYQMESGGKFQIYYNEGLYLTNSLRRNSVLEKLKVSDQVDSLAIEDVRKFEIGDRSAFSYDGTGLISSAQTKVSVVMFEVSKGSMVCVLTVPEENSEADIKQFDSLIKSIVIDDDDELDAESSPLSDAVSVQMISLADVPEGVQKQDGQICETVAALHEQASVLEVIDADTGENELKIVYHSQSPYVADSYEAYKQFMAQVLESGSAELAGGYQGVWFCLIVDDKMVTVNHYEKFHEGQFALAHQGIFDESYSDLLEES